MHRRHHVDRDAEGLEAEEQHDQIVGAGHDHTTCGGEQHEDIHLDTVDALAAQVVVEQERDEDDGRCNHAGDHQREPVDSILVPECAEGTIDFESVIPQAERGRQRGEADRRRERSIEAYPQHSSPSSADRCGDRKAEDEHAVTDVAAHACEHRIGSGEPVGEAHANH
jgi:hypothetical protein